MATKPALINRTVIESLKEGECLKAGQMKTIEYYKDYPFQKKSYIKGLIEKG